MKPEPVHVFLSYSHDDTAYLENFIKHFGPLLDRQKISIWHDQKNHPGSEFQAAIDREIESSEIICLFISASFLDSAACKTELDKALKLQTSQGTEVVPIIVKECGWQDVAEVCSKLAIPKDGRAVTSFPEEDDAWSDVYKQMKPVVDKILQVKAIERNDKYLEFLDSVDLLEKSHAGKEKLSLDDIYIYPDLVKDTLSEELNVVIKSNDVLEEVLSKDRIIVSGESQSGKTSLAKQLIKGLPLPRFFPVYVQISSSNSKGHLNNAIQEASRKKFSTPEDAEIPENRIVPIVDDFHNISNKDRAIKILKRYPKSVLIVDDVFSLNLQDGISTHEYINYGIKEYSPSLRSRLLKKWHDVGDQGHSSCTDQYEKHDRSTEMLDAMLGKIIGNGIIPSYPFYILSILSMSEAMERPLNQEITSQGYCYQSLIYLCLLREGVNNDDVDTYINFLTELAGFVFIEQRHELSIDEFNSFLEQYRQRFLIIEESKLLEKLKNARLVQRDGFNNYSFTYRYLYYFFAAKYLSENRDENQKKIDNIINNLHKNENAYIAIFISHHTKDMYLLDEIVLNALCLFDKHTPATLASGEIGFFDDQISHILQASLPPVHHSTEMARSKKLEIQDQKEEATARPFDTDEDLQDDLKIEMRRAIKTVEVMGRVIKNRAGSLEKETLERIFESAMDVHLRILSSFFSLISSQKNQDELVQYIVGRMKTKIAELKAKEESKGREYIQPNESELRTMASKLFWKLNFLVVYGVVHKIIHSLGSDKLLPVVDSVCKQKDSPASFIVKHGIYMWYKKNLRLDEIKKRIDEDDFSDTGKEVLKYLIVEHCTLHKLKYDERQKVEAKLGLSSKRLLQAQSRKR